MMNSVPRNSRSNRSLILSCLTFSLIISFVQPLFANFPLSYAERLVLSGGHEHLGSEISKAIHEGRIQPAEFEKLDFTMPGMPGYGDNIAYEVFNPASPRTVMSDNKHFPPLFEQKRIDDATTVPGTRVLFNLRRTIRPDGTFLDTLATVVPNMDIRKCDPVMKLDVHLEIPPNVSVIAVDSIPEIYGKCLQVPDGRAYLLFHLVQRVKWPDDEEWRPAHLYFNPNTQKKGGE